MKVLWDIWLYRDLIAGDTARYFAGGGASWANKLELDPVWSPLYGVFLGTLQKAMDDPYAIAIIHRVLIVVAVSLAVLAVFRALLPPGIAWALALWWALLPVNYDTLYEVYLFGLLPAATAILLAQRLSDRLMWGSVLTVLLLGAVTSRYELLIAAVAWCGAWLVAEVRRASDDREDGLGRRLRRTAVAFVVPLLITGAVATFVVVRSNADRSVAEAFSDRQDATVCQNYAVGYKQLHDDFGGSPSLDCAVLSKRVFGAERPTPWEALTANPGAMREYILWNVALIPAGVQLALFNAISADRGNPDVIPVSTGSLWALVGLLAVLSALAAGAILAWRERRRWGSTWLKSRAFGWLALGCVASSALPSILLIRPRPCLIFYLTVAMLALIGLAALIIGARWPRLADLRWTLPMLALAAIALVPSHYGPGYETPQTGLGRPVLAAVRHVEPFQEKVSDPSVSLAAPRFASAICHYLVMDEGCTPVDVPHELASQPFGTSLPALLERKSVDVAYFDESMMRNPGLRASLKQLSRAGWKELASSRAAAAPWMLLSRPAGQ